MEDEHASTKLDESPHVSEEHGIDGRRRRGGGVRTRRAGGAGRRSRGRA